MEDEKELSIRATILFLLFHNYTCKVVDTIKIWQLSLALSFIEFNLLATIRPPTDHSRGYSMSPLLRYRIPQGARCRI